MMNELVVCHVPALGIEGRAARLCVRLCELTESPAIDHALELPPEPLPPDHNLYASGQPIWNRPPSPAMVSA